MRHTIKAWAEQLTRLPYLLLTLAPLFWAGNAVLGRGMRDAIPPVALAFWRWALAFLILLPFAWRYARRDWPRFSGRWPVTLLVAFLGVTCFNTMLYTALQTTPAVNASALQTAMPAVVVVLSWLIFSEKITLTQGVGVLLSMGGALLIVLRGSWQNLLSLTFVGGDMVLLTAVGLYALYSVMLRKAPAVHPLSFLVVTFGAGLLMLSPLYLWEISTIGGFDLNSSTGLTLLYVAVFPSILSYLCWNQGVVAIGANRAGLFINFLPAFTAVLAILFLGELVLWFHGLGMAFIFSGMILFNRRPRRAGAPPLK